MIETVMDMYDAECALSYTSEGLEKREERQQIAINRYYGNGIRGFKKLKDSYSRKRSIVPHCNVILVQV